MKFVYFNSGNNFIDPSYNPSYKKFTQTHSPQHQMRIKIFHLQSLNTTRFFLLLHIHEDCFNVTNKKYNSKKKFFNAPEKEFVY